MAKKRSEFLSALGIQKQIWEALTNEVLDLGGSDEHIRRIETDKGLRRKIAVLIAGSVNTPKHIISVSSSFTRDMRNEGWKLTEDTPVTEGETLDVSSLELMSFLRDGENYVKGEEMKNRARDLGARYGQRHAEAWLANPHLIPAEFRPHYLVFPGTVWLVRSRYRYVPYLHWHGDRWYLYFHWLVCGFNGSVRVVRSRK